MKGPESKEKPKRGRPVKRAMPGPIPDTAEIIANTPKRGRPKSRILNIDSTPEYAAQAMFAAADAKIKKRSTKKKEGSD